MEITLKYVPGINRYGAMSVIQGVFKRVRAYVWHLSFYIMRNHSLYSLRHVSETGYNEFLYISEHSLQIYISL